MFDRKKKTERDAQDERDKLARASIRYSDSVVFLPGESPGRIMLVCLGTDHTGAIEFRMLSKDRIEDALIVQQHSMRQECIAIGMGMYENLGAPEEMQLVFREVIKDGCTVIAVDRSDRVVAVAFNKLHASIKSAVLNNRYKYDFISDMILSSTAV